MVPSCRQKRIEPEPAKPAPTNGPTYLPPKPNSINQSITPPPTTAPSFQSRIRKFTTTITTRKGIGEAAESPEQKRKLQQEEEQRVVLTTDRGAAAANSPLPASASAVAFRRFGRGRKKEEEERRGGLVFVYTPLCKQRRSKPLIAGGRRRRVEPAVGRTNLEAAAAAGGPSIYGMGACRLPRRESGRRE